MIRKRAHCKSVPFKVSEISYGKDFEVFLIFLRQEGPVIWIKRQKVGVFADPNIISIADIRGHVNKKLA